MLRESKKKVGKSNGPAVALQVGQNVRRLRQERGVNLSDLAASAGISLPMLSRLEKGDVTPSWPRRWARMHPRC